MYERRERRLGRGVVESDNYVRDGQIKIPRALLKEKDLDEENWKK